MRLTSRLHSWGAAAIVAALLVLPAAAFASGGGTIQGAPTVSFGVQEFGNTLTDGSAAVDTCDTNGAANDQGDAWSFWRVPVIAGDHLTINFGGSGINSTILFGPGTTDYSLGESFDSEVASANEGTNGYGQLTYVARTDGLMPLLFATGCDSSAGPYNFTVSVRHELIVSLTVGASRNHVTNFYLNVHTPDGTAIPLTGLTLTGEDLQHGRWTALGGRVPRLEHFVIRWGRGTWGKRQSLRIVVSGAGYLAASGTARTGDV